MKKTFVIISTIAALAIFAYWYSSRTDTHTAEPTPPTDTPATTTGTPAASEIELGTYQVIPNESTISWSAEKPRIEGYVNSGILPVASGTIEVYQNVVAGLFVMDMNALSVALTAHEPGLETALETHLKGPDFFDVEKYPIAEFRIRSISPRPDVTTTFTYDLLGDLTIKEITNQITIPAVLQKEGDNLVARAQFEIDRTLWDINLGSEKFYTDLGENMIDDMVHLMLVIVARPVTQTMPDDTSNASSTGSSTSTTTTEDTP